jgi:multicomponent Na+:H+ antiporter subunit E
MSSAVDKPRSLPRGSLTRAAGFYAFWVILSGFNPADLLMGALAAILATWTSLRLLPPDESRFSYAALARLALRFIWQSAVAGIDVARRALDPRLPLQPGFVTYPVRFSAGTSRNVFAMFTSLLPGTVPAGDESGQLIYHCLDVDQPVVSQLAAEEAALSQVVRDD